MKLNAEAKLRQVTRDIAGTLVVIQKELADIGLYQTMHAVNDAAKKLGWEAAGKLSRPSPQPRKMKGK